MRLNDAQRRYLSRRAWQIYPAFYLLGVSLAFTRPLVIPFMVAVPLLGVAAIYTLMEWSDLRKQGLVACAVALALCAFGLILLGLPESLQVPAWILAMVIPLVLTVSMLRLTQSVPLRPHSERPG